MTNPNWECPAGGEHDLTERLEVKSLPVARSDIVVGGKSPKNKLTHKTTYCKKCRIVFDIGEDE